MPTAMFLRQRYWMSRVEVREPARQVVTRILERLSAHRDRPALRNAIRSGRGNGGEWRHLGKVFAVEGARLAQFGMSFDDVHANAGAGFEALGLEQRIRVGQRQHAPVELAADPVAGLEIVYLRK